MRTSTQRVFFFPDALELSVLKDPQEFCLQGRRNFPDFIQEQGAAIG
jgi:hypothetical protein